MRAPLLLLAILACETGKDTGAPADTSARDADGDRWADWEDCDDANPTVNPGMIEIPYDGADNDCDPSTLDDDLDRDGFGADEDCDDGNPDAFPGAVETCDGVDEDCDGVVDEEPSDGVTAWADADGDGFGDPDTAAPLCVLVAGWVLDGTDCDDADPSVHPGAEEVCDGVDQDCDGLVDDGLATVTGWGDADGDGYGDPSDRRDGCDLGDAVVSNDKDCDDADPDANPSEVERQDGHDDDCDGVVDEAVVGIVVGYQCQVYAASYWAGEVGAIHAYLTDLALGWEEFEEDLTSGDDETYVAQYDLALFCKCGWAWQSYNQDMIDAFLDARGRGTATLLFDDDIAWYQHQVDHSEDLVFLSDAPHNGSYSTSAAVDPTCTHPACLGPHGTPADFTYNWDMDRSAGIGAGEVVLGTHTGSYPWWVVWEDPVSGVRAGTMVASLYAANEGHVGTAAEANLEIVFKNTVAWLLAL